MQGLTPRLGRIPPANRVAHAQAEPARSCTPIRRPWDQPLWLQLLALGHWYWSFCVVLVWMGRVVRGGNCVNARHWRLAEACRVCNTLVHSAEAWDGQRTACREGSMLMQMGTFEGQLFPVPAPRSHGCGLLLLSGKESMANGLP